MKEKKFIKVLSIGDSAEETICIVNKDMIECFTITNYFEDDYSCGTLYLKNGKDILVSEDGIEQLQKDLLDTTITKKKKSNTEYNINTIDIILEPNSNWNKDISIQNRMKILKQLTCKYKEKIATKIKLMSYKDFLTTLYWKAISTYIKIMNRKCAICGSTFDLHTHHKNYSNHGYEINHLEDLEVICGRCHFELHKKDKKEIKK